MRWRLDWVLLATYGVDFELAIRPGSYSFIKLIGLTPKRLDASLTDFSNYGSFRSAEYLKLP